MAAELQSHSVHPRHPPVAFEAKNDHETYIDPYNYLEGKGNKQILEDFKELESEWTDSYMLKYGLLHNTILKESDARHYVPRALPIQVGDHVYYRKIDNVADNMTIYRYPANRVQRGEMPTKDLDLYEEIAFSLPDLYHYYEEFGSQSEMIREFVEKLRDVIYEGRFDPIYSFKTNTNYSAIILDTEGN